MDPSAVESLDWRQSLFVSGPGPVSLPYRLHPAAAPHIHAGQLEPAQVHPRLLLGSRTIGFLYEMHRVETVYLLLFIDDNDIDTENYI